MENIIKDRIMEWANSVYAKCWSDKDNICIHNFGERKRNIMVIDLNTGNIGKAFCSPEDDYNYVMGVAVAYAKLRGIKIPDIVFGAFKVKDLMGQYIYLPEYSKSKCVANKFYVTPIFYHNTDKVVVVNCYDGSSFAISGDITIPKRNIVRD